MGILEDLIGGNQPVTPGLLDAAGYMDPAQYDRARRSSAMDGLWAGLLAGSGPSLEPRNFYSALGVGMQGRQQYGSQFDKDQLEASQAAQARAAVQKSAYDITSKKLVLDKYLNEFNQAGTAGSGAAGAVGAGGGAAPGSGGGGGGGGAGGGPGSISPAEHYTFLLNNGASANEAALLTSAAGAESSFRPDATHDGGIGYGLYGHNGPRLEGMRSVAGVGAKDPVPWQQQSLYALAELRGQAPTSEIKAGEMARAAQTPEQLTQAQLAFERPRGWDTGGGNREQRLALTSQYFNNPPYREASAETRQPLPEVGTRSLDTASAAPSVRPGFDTMFPDPSGRAASLGGPVPAAIAAGVPPAAPAPAATTPAPSKSPGSITPQERTAWIQSRAAGGQDTIEDFVGALRSGRGDALRPRADAGGPDTVVPTGPLAQLPGLNGAPPAAAGGLAAMQLAALVSGGSGGRLPTGAAPSGDTVVPPSALPAAPAPAPAATQPPTAPGSAASALPPPPGAYTPPAAPTLPQPPAPLPAAALPPLPAPVAVPGRPDIPAPAQAPTARMSPQELQSIKQAQAMSGMLSIVGIPVPEWLSKRAGRQEDALSELAKREATQPIELQNKQFDANLTAAQKQWDALTDQQKETLAASRGMQKDQFQATLNNAGEAYKTLLGVTAAGPTAYAQQMEAARAELIKQTGATEQKIREEYDIPRTLDGPPDAQGNPTKIFTTYRKMQEAIAAGQGAPGAAPIPGAMRSGLGPGAQQTQTGLAGVYVDKVKEVSAAADAARRGLSSTEILLNSPKINWGGPLAGPKQEFNRVMTSLFGVNTEEVKTYEQAAQLMGDTMRTALRASDPNPTDRQQQSLYATLPGPARSAAGFQAGLRYMAGMQDWQVWRNAQLNQHLRPDPGNPNKVTDPAAFFQNENMSGIPFIVARMLPEDRKAYFAKVRETDPAALTKLINQLERIGANQ